MNFTCSRRRPSIRSWVLGGVGICFFMVGPAWPVFGQGFGLRQEFSAEANLIQAPREVERLLEQAEDAISAEEWTEATLALGMLLG